MPLTPPPGVLADRWKSAATHPRLPVADANNPTAPTAECSASGRDLDELLAQIESLRRIVEARPKIERAKGAIMLPQGLASVADRAAVSETRQAPSSGSDGGGK